MGKVYECRFKNKINKTKGMLNCNVPKEIIKRVDRELEEKEYIYLGQTITLKKDYEKEIK